MMGQEKRCPAELLHQCSSDTRIIQANLLRRVNDRWRKNEKGIRHFS